ncbi:hypothetical protein B0T24DRAFT_676760 [Lasiosphaeria ovina]|uniref:Uncharacterized protein n=1 Tax=Lasiosphaeria ovina TaxID=92902 RepID=A0AAE0KGK3_9PEZI|nr:hypothetical protein B0T24DRAFT_676760 [Lasiosphaeria ovina]
MAAVDNARMASNRRMLPETARVQARHLQLTRELDDMTKQFDYDEQRDAKAFENAMVAIDSEVDAKRREFISQMPTNMPIPDVFENMLLDIRSRDIRKAEETLALRRAQRKKIFDAKMLQHVEKYKATLFSPMIPIRVSAISLPSLPLPALESAFDLIPTSEPTKEREVMNSPAPVTRAVPPFTADQMVSSQPRRHKPEREGAHPQMRREFERESVHSQMRREPERDSVHSQMRREPERETARPQFRREPGRETSQSQIRPETERETVQQQLQTRVETIAAPTVAPQPAPQPSPQSPPKPTLQVAVERPTAVDEPRAVVVEEDLGRSSPDSIVVRSDTPPPGRLSRVSSRDIESKPADSVVETELTVHVSRPVTPVSRREGSTGSVDDSQHKRKADEPSSSQSTPKRTKLKDARDPIDTVSVVADAMTPRRRGKKSGRKTISYDEVFQGGNAQYKHIIVDYPPSSNNFYILKCDEHGVHFNQNPLAGAAKHLHSAQHGNMSKERAQAVELLGHLVFDCDPKKAAANNEIVSRAFAKGYKPLNLNQLTKTERSIYGLPPLDAPTSAQKPASQFVHETPSNSSTSLAHQLPVGIKNPTPGELYLGYWTKEKKNYAVLLLPRGDLKCAGMHGTLSDTGLLIKAPKCYVIDRMSMQIKGWAPGYEDGGPLEMKRDFPVMYFDGRRSVGWLRAKDLSPFNFQNPCWKDIPFFREAVQHYALVRGFKSYDQMVEKSANMNLKMFAQDRSSKRQPLPSSASKGAQEKQTIDAQPSTSERRSARVATVEADEPEIEKRRTKHSTPEDHEMTDVPNNDDSDDSYQESIGKATSDSENDIEMNADSRRTSVSNRGETQEEADASVTVSKPTSPVESPTSIVEASEQASTEVTPTQETPTDAIFADAVIQQASPTVATPQQVTPIQQTPTEATPTQATPTLMTPMQAMPTQTLSPANTKAVVATDTTAATNGTERSVQAQVQQIAASALFLGSPERELLAALNGAKDHEARRSSTTPQPSPPLAQPTNQKLAPQVVPITRRSTESPRELQTPFSPLATPDSNTRASSPSQPKSNLSAFVKSEQVTQGSGQSVDVFDLARFEEGGDELFSAASSGKFLRLIVNPETKKAVTGPGEACTFTLDPLKIKAAVVEPSSESGQGCTVTLQLVDGREQKLGFETANSMGRGGEGGRIHARRFCRWVKTVNLNIDYRNNSFDSNQRPSQTPTSATTAVSITVE